MSKKRVDRGGVVESACQGFEVFPVGLFGFQDVFDLVGPSVKFVGGESDGEGAGVVYPSEDRLGLLDPSFGS